MEDFAHWYIKNGPDYDSLLIAEKSIIESLLKSERISFYLVKLRVKSYDSFLGKLTAKKHAQPEDMIDFAALRVICHLKRDQKIVVGLLEDNFHIIKKEDKSLDLGVNRLGYNAIHLDAKLKHDRARSPEHEKYKNFNLKSKSQLFFNIPTQKSHTI